MRLIYFFSILSLIFISCEKENIEPTIETEILEPMNCEDINLNYIDVYEPRVLAEMVGDIYLEIEDSTLTRIQLIDLLKQYNVDFDSLMYEQKAGVYVKGEGFRNIAFLSLKEYDCEKCNKIIASLNSNSRIKYATPLFGSMLNTEKNTLGLTNGVIISETNSPANIKFLKDLVLKRNYKIEQSEYGESYLISLEIKNGYETLLLSEELNRKYGIKSSPNFIGFITLE